MYLSLAITMKDFEEALGNQHQNFHYYQVKSCQGERLVRFFFFSRFLFYILLLFRCFI